MRAIADKLKVPIVIFQACENLAGYLYVACATPFQEEEEEEHATGFKIICLTRNKNYYDMLVVNDSKEMQLHNKLVELLHHFTP